MRLTSEFRKLEVRKQSIQNRKKYFIKLNREVNFRKVYFLKRHSTEMHTVCSTSHNVL